MPSGHCFEGIFVFLFCFNLKGIYQHSIAAHGSFVRKKFADFSLFKSKIV